MTETTPPPEDQLPETSGGDLLPGGPDELRPEDPTEEGLPEDEQGGDQSVEEAEQEAATQGM